MLTLYKNETGVPALYLVCRFTRAQMENIQLFLNFCESYGVPKTGLFQTVDLYEGRNLPQVLNCIQQLGTEASLSITLQLKQSCRSSESHRHLLRCFLQMCLHYSSRRYLSPKALQDFRRTSRWYLL